MKTRGIRNNNPANIRRGCNWQGLAKTQTDREFCQFISMTWGVRALLVTLRTYVVKYKLHTIPEIIQRWAPPEDGNATNRYIAYVEEKVKQLDAPISLSLKDYDFLEKNQHDECILYTIAKAMCFIESRYNLDYETYLNAIHLM